MSVEVYAYYENKSTFLPDMIKERSEHSAVSMGNKMFVIGGFKTNSCEVFNSIDKNFCFILPYPGELTDTPFLFTFDKKVVVITQSEDSFNNYYVYDSDENIWKTEKLFLCSKRAVSKR